MTGPEARLTPLPGRPSPPDVKTLRQESRESERGSRSGRKGTGLSLQDKTEGWGWAFGWREEAEGRLL